ncbi:hypothetical protein SASPL_116852 [Salvia splendens]|uniref:Heat shock 70kDa protein 1/8 n=1 Tax=Salvia splendens TaxID=180675 RepID=A0A8X8ZX79_SALSN|nr:hypothetical protein SASPL_116852 [Salvia splendens]
MARKGEGRAIGIDLGTTYTCVAVWKHGRIEIIVNDQGNRTTPSYVAFTDTERLVGDAANNQAARNPINTVFGEFSLQISVSCCISCNACDVRVCLRATSYVAFTDTERLVGDAASNQAASNPINTVFGEFPLQ